MQLEERFKPILDHPLRYSDYVSKDRLLQHLNDLSIDQSDQIIMQSVRPIRVNMLRLTVPNQNKEELLAQKYRQNETMRQQSPIRRILSRENISHMNRRLKQIRMNNYSPGSNPEQELDKTKYQNNLTSGSDSHRSKTALLTARPLNGRYQDLRMIPEVRGIASSLQVHSKASRNFRTAQHKSLKRKVQRKEQQLKNEQKKLKVQPSLAYAQFLSKSQLPVTQKVVPNQFKAKLKKKCVEDNINVMASLIKKKVKVLNKQDMYQYISYLMNRHISKGSRN